MTEKQELFNRIVKGIRKQGKLAYSNGNCYYRAPDGSKCAAGQVMPDYAYKPKFEKNFISTIVSNFPKDFEKFPRIMKRNVDFISDCQSVHDNIAFGSSTHNIKGYLRAMKKFGQRHNLDTSVCD